jgi:hypothetical protein
MTVYRVQSGISAFIVENLDKVFSDIPADMAQEVSIIIPPPSPWTDKSAATAPTPPWLSVTGHSMARELLFYDTFKWTSAIAARLPDCCVCIHKESRCTDRCAASKTVHIYQTCLVDRYLRGVGCGSAVIFIKPGRCVASYNNFVTQSIMPSLLATPLVQVYMAECTPDARYMLSRLR